VKEVAKVNALYDFIDRFWEDDILESLSAYIEIPNKSPAFDADWESHGYMQAAADHMIDWVNSQNVPGLTVELYSLPGRTPTILLEHPGHSDDTVLIYGHLDKQPEFNGWHEGLGPWQAVQRDDKLYGRGGADDGYAIYAAVCAIKALQAQNLAFPRIVTLIEASEESGSPDLPFYMESLSDRIGKPSLVVALDSTAGNYDQLWVTTSLRGLVAGELRVDVLEQGAHSGAAGGIVASSFRIVRQLLSRIENEETGEILPSFLNEQIPESRRQEAIAAGEVLKNDFPDMFTFAGNSGPLSNDPVELVLNNTWLSSLEITGIDGIPDPEDAGNVLRPYTTAKFSLRVPPTTDVDRAMTELKDLLTNNAPNSVAVSLELDEPAAGWHAPETSPRLAESLEAASNAYFGAPAVSLGCGGSIPFMQFLAESLPEAQFVVTGVLGPHSNAHGPNEFLHIPTAKKVTACVAHVLHDWNA
jgi:acetylornithine deacetylase/succinyl-diaminopimelate desuccinylase-like protein